MVEEEEDRDAFRGDPGIQDPRKSCRIPATPDQGFQESPQPLEVGFPGSLYFRAVGSQNSCLGGECRLFVCVYYSMCV